MGQADSIPPVPQLPTLSEDPMKYPQSSSRDEDENKEEDSSLCDFIAEHGVLAGISKRVLGTALVDRRFYTDFEVGLTKCRTYPTRTVSIPVSTFPMPAPPCSWRPRAPLSPLPGVFPQWVGFPCRWLWCPGNVVSFLNPPYFFE